MSALDNAITRSRSLALSVKAAGPAVEIGGGDSGFSGMGSSGADRQRYNQFHGHLYSVINVVAREAAGQPICLGKVKGSKREERQSLVTRKAADSQLPKRLKSAGQEWELILDDPILQKIENPNSFQPRWQFVYSFIANLLLTGRSYIVGGQGEDGPEFYSLPSSWVTPVHKNGPYAEFKVQDPGAVGGADKALLTRENVAFAYLPDPSKPLGAMAPSGSQQVAIQIDGKIQGSQLQYFDKGIFPSAIVTVGKDPHPDVPGGGIRPRLTPEQRRQVTAAIQKTMSGVANYGNPAIIDGMIERIDRLSATADEMGWESSEERIRSRILSAFGVHPMLLGEKEVANYATAYKIEERFFEILNSYTDMLSSVLTSFAIPILTDSPDNYQLWIEPKRAVDQSLRFTALANARKNGDITKNEYRTEALGLPIDETVTDETRSKLLDTVGGMTGFVNISRAVAMGEVPYSGGVQSLMLFFQISQEQAEALLGGERAEVVPVATPPAVNQDDDNDEEEESNDEEPEEIDEEEVMGDNPSGENAVRVISVSETALANLIHASAKLGK